MYRDIYSIKYAVATNLHSETMLLPLVVATKLFKESC